MNRNAEALIEQAGAYASVFDRVAAGGRFDGASSEGAIRLVSDQELLRAAGEASRLVRLAQAEQARIAGEIARRSEPRDGSSLAKRMGASGPAALVAEVTGTTRAQAGTAVASGTAFRSRESLTGEALPPAFPQVAEAFAAGLLDPEVAAAMRRALAKAAPGLAPDEADELERQVLEIALQGWAADDVIGWLKQAPGMAHPEGGAPSTAEPAPLPSVTRKVLRNGLVRRVLDLDALTDGFLKTAIDANTAMKRTVIAVPDDPAADPDAEDRRPLAQRRVDGVHRLAKKAVRVDDGQVGGTAVTMLVTITETALRTGLGAAQLPDCGTEISAGVARMLAADAEIIPVVLGGQSQPLDLGQGRQYFSEAQRRAMAVRDGGCAGPLCDAPPSWCDGAHLRPAGYRPTSSDNGLLLCWRCHLLHDVHGWQVEREDGRWWWTPPPWIDPTGRRRPGGRIPPIDLYA
ncbi:HNH endonuclease signature motif containing protein [Amnibacterium setariae]|uniref:HNH endonuclease n=1 Tax=Amnibacterium setariae TaxID=2306585 RepID=A0A3A1TWN9_9MICO|nr:HNH endonuclease signature motif containing protein [Amnibacterium setariae]RIX28028.1 HNH endonuclease [Amnibacterium setariae]